MVIEEEMTVTAQTSQSHGLHYCTVNYAMYEKQVKHYMTLV